MVNAEQPHFENKELLRRINHAVAGYLNARLQPKVNHKREIFSPELSAPEADMLSMNRCYKGNKSIVIPLTALPLSPLNVTGKAATLEPGALPSYLILRPQRRAEAAGS